MEMLNLLNKYAFVSGGVLMFYVYIYIRIYKFYPHGMLVTFPG
jgi:hypothetical protein